MYKLIHVRAYTFWLLQFYIAYTTLNKLLAVFLWIIWDIFTKFGVLVIMVSPQRTMMSFLGYTEIQNGGRQPFWKKRKIAITRPPFEVLSPNWRGGRYGQSATCCYLTFDRLQNPRWRPAAFLKKVNLHNSRYLRWRYKTAVYTGVNG